MPVNKPPAAEVRFSGPGLYRIEVKGSLRADWSGRFGDMRVSPSRSKHAEVTILKGRVKDQSDLAGVLGMLHQFHLPLLSVEHFEECKSRREDTDD